MNVIAWTLAAIGVVVILFALVLLIRRLLDYVDRRITTMLAEAIGTPDRHRNLDTEYRNLVIAEHNRD